MFATMVGQAPLDVHRSLNGCGRIVERYEEPVTRVVDLLAPMPREQGPKGPIVPGEELLPRVVAQSLGQRGGPNDIREHEGLGDFGGRHRHGRPAVLPRILKSRLYTLQSRDRAQSLEG